MSAEIHHFVNGQVTAGNSARHADVFNPASGEKTATVDLASSDETRAAIAAADEAFPAWAAMTPLRRARVMFRFKELLEQHADELVGLITREHG